MVKAAALLGLLPVAARASFQVRPFSHYETSDPSSGSAPGVRRFHHHEQHLLEDGAAIELRWQVDADPSTILPLDLHRDAGVRVLECSPAQLVLQVLEHHALSAHQWQHITASSDWHGCRHLPERDLYHRVLSVDDVKPIAGHPHRHHTVKLTTKELRAATDVFPNCEVFLDLDPSGQRVLSRNTLPAPRRLDGLLTTEKVMPKIIQTSHFTPEENHVESPLNFQLPKQLSRLNWNWDYNLNTTDNPRFQYNFPGGQGKMKLYKPYMISNISMKMNFSSHLKDIRKPPHVSIATDIEGAASMNVTLATIANFTKRKAAGKLDDVVKKLLPHFGVKQPFHMFLEPLKLDLGGTPLTIQPKFTTTLKAYHIGLMHGSLRIGLATDLQIHGWTTFDTIEGVQTNVTAKAMNVEFTPPNWMIFTEAFEMGMMLEPELCMEGGFADVENMAMCLGFRPYFNVSIEQEGANVSLGGYTEATSGSSGLAIYPFRVVGLPAGKDYSMHISANGKTVNTTTQMSTGVAEYFDDVEKFDFGTLNEAELIGEPIKVELFEDGRGDPVGVGQAFCNSIVNGMCNPNPLVANLKVDGQDVSVELAAVFASSPDQFLKSQTKSISLRFPTVTASGDLSKKLEDPEALKTAALRLTRNGRSYDVPLNSKLNSTMLLQGNTIFELGPSFIGSWKFPAAQDSILTPKIELLVNGKTAGSGSVPPVAWDSLGAGQDYDDMTQQAQQSLKAIPLMVPISDSDGQIVGTAQMEIDVLPASKSAFWVQPGEASFFKVGNEETFSWAVHGGQENMEYDFTLEALEVSKSGGLTKTGWQANIKSQCSINKTAADQQVLRYTGGAVPCLFMYKIEIPSDLAGYHVVMVAGWQDAGKRYHQMMSAPVSFVKEDDPRARRLADSQWGLQHGSANSKKADEIEKEAQRQWQEMKNKCNAKPLRYEVGAGMTFVEKMRNVMMPMTMPMYMGDSSSPDWTSEPVSVFKLGQNRNDEGKGLDQLLPKSVCAGGVCNGMMPGCRETQANPISVKQIVFKLHKNMSFNGTGKNAFPLSENMRNAIAYGLALLPSAIQMANRSETLGATFGKWTSGGSKSTSEASSGDSSDSPSPLRETLDGAMSMWHKGLNGRRLSGGVDNGVFEVGFDDEESNDALHGLDTFAVDIVEPMHYTLTREYLQTLINRGTFRIEDDHGPVPIDSFEFIMSDEIDEAPKLLRQKTRPAASTRSVAQTVEKFSFVRIDSSRSSLPVATGMIGFVALGVAATAAALSMRRRGGCRGYYTAVSSPHHEEHRDFA
jgi:hypothetical protein